jgi:hypothetical protein
MSKPKTKRNRKCPNIQAVIATERTRVSLPDIPAEWDQLGQVLGADLEQLALETKALVRKRQVRCAQDLLRLVLAYALWDWSFQLVGAWATALGLGSLSAVAIRQRLRHSHQWLSRLLGHWLSVASQPLAARRVRLRLIDASVITQPGSTGTDWRVHLSFDVGALRLDEFEITDAHGGESLLRHAVAAGDLVVVDRGYAQRTGLGPLLASGAQVVVRINGHNLPLETAAGQGLELRRWLQRVPARHQQRTRPVWITTPQGRFELRLVARRLPPAAGPLGGGGEQLAPPGLVADGDPDPVPDPLASRTAHQTLQGPAASGSVARARPGGGASLPAGQSPGRLVVAGWVAPTDRRLGRVV